MDKPLILPVILFIAGILLGASFLYVPWSALAAMALAVLWFALHSRSARSGWRGFLRSAGSLALGAGLAVLALTSVPAGHYRNSPFFDGPACEVSLQVASPLDRDRGRTAFQADVSAINGIAASGRIRVTVREEQTGVGYGDRLSVRGRIFPVRSYRNPGGTDHRSRLARQGIFGVLSARRSSDIALRHQGTGLLRWVQDLRERIRQAFLRSTSGEGSAVLQAMVLGEEGMLTDGLRDRFMAAGVTHILSISGSHLGLVAIICFWTARNLFFLLPERWYHRLTLSLDPAKTAAFLTVLPVTFYAFLAGGQTATVRSLIMILAGLAALMLNRERDLLSALALAALITLVPEPQALFDLSFQLSFLSVLAILFVADTDARIERPAATRLQRMLRAGLMLLAVSLAATIVTAPLVALHFHRLSLAGIAANMVVVPFAGVFVVPIGLLSGILSLLFGELPFAGLDQAVADAFVALVSFFADLPAASVPVSAPGPLFLTGYVLLVAAAALWARTLLLSRSSPLAHAASLPRTVPAAAAAGLGLLTAALLLPLLAERPTQAIFLDVGQGDCTFVRSAGGTTVLVDGGGTRDNRFDVGRSVVEPFLHDRGIRKLDLIVLSHPHPDHMHGLLTLLKHIPVRELWWSGRDGSLEGFEDLRREAEAHGTLLRPVAAGHRATIGDLSLDVLHPPAGAWQTKGRAYAGENDRSLVLRLAAGPATFLFPGDLHEDGEGSLVGRYGDLRADVLKVPHHGSRTSSSSRFISAVRPALAVIPVGEGNPYRHPSDAVVERYAAAGAAVCRTDRDGAIIVQAAESGMSSMRWADLLLQEIDPGRIARWTEQERENWKRLWIRTRGI